MRFKLHISNKSPMDVLMGKRRVLAGQTRDHEVSRMPVFLNIHSTPPVGFYNLGTRKISGASQKKYGILIRYGKKSVELRADHMGNITLDITVNKYGQLELSGDVWDMIPVKLESLTCSQDQGA